MKVSRLKALYSALKLPRRSIWKKAAGRFPERVRLRFVGCKALVGIHFALGRKSSNWLNASWLVIWRQGNEPQGVAIKLHLASG